MSVYQDRCSRAQALMMQEGIDFLAISITPDLFYLTGYTNILSERLTAFVLPKQGRPTMIMPAFESVRLEQEGYVVFYDVRPWTETESPFPLVRQVVGGDDSSGRTVGISEQMWSVFLIGIQEVLPRARYVNASRVLTPLRMIKDAQETEYLLEVGRRMDAVFAEASTLRFAGRTEREVGDDLFQIVKIHGLSPTRAGGVASGPNSASPHHRSSDRQIQWGDAIWLELGQGGSYRGYRADMTRCAHVGPQSETYKKVYAVVKEAQETAFQGIRPGIECQAIDRAGRAVIERAGYGQYFTHRLGHGLGLDGHEPPYIIEGNTTRLQPGMVFSDEPGVYIPGQFGIRIEDIVIVTETGARRIYASTCECVEVK